MSAAENINPQILVWARESAGLTIADAAAKIGLTATSQKTPESKLLELENGENGPTRHQLTKISSVYHRPLTVFYRNRIPTVEDRGEDFRTSAGEVTAIQCGLLDALLRDVRARQGMVRGIVESGEDYSKLAFVGSISVADRPDSVVNEVRRLLEIVTSAPPGHGKRDSKVLFDDLRTRVEKLGIFVVLMGNLGSHHSAIDSKVFRGFALAKHQRFSAQHRQRVLGGVRRPILEPWLGLRHGRPKRGCANAGCPRQDRNA